MDISAPQSRADSRKGMSSELAPLRRHTSSGHFRKRLPRASCD
uniref:Excision repair cross-complementing rodent repair deficiency, complementation group 6 like 2 n=1 Tax=Mus musculus TaxID=10090 RepID=E9QPI9_MOUSE